MRREPAHGLQHVGERAGLVRVNAERPIQRVTRPDGRHAADGQADLLVADVRHSNHISDIVGRQPQAP